MTDAIIRRRPEGVEKKDVTTDKQWLKDRIERLAEKREMFAQRIENIDNEMQERETQLKELN